LWYVFDRRGLLSAYAFSGEELGPKDIKTLEERDTDGGIGLGIGSYPGNGYALIAWEVHEYLLHEEGWSVEVEIQERHLRYTTGP